MAPLSQSLRPRGALRAESGVRQLARDLRLRLLRDARVDLAGDLRVRVPREHRGLGERDARVEGDRDERVPEVVQPDRLDALAVQPGGVARVVDGAERVT